MHGDITPSVHSVVGKLECCQSPFLESDSSLAGLVGLYLGGPPGFVNPVSWRDCRARNQVVGIELLKAFDLLLESRTPQLSIGHLHRILKRPRNNRL